jgi:thiol-disulfide isomerase/thioredoxin
MEEYMNLVQGEAKNKHIFIDFYMEGCYYCYVLQNDFNDIADDMYAWYGKENVEIIKVDGQRASDIANYFRINSYPQFLSVAPNTNGKGESMYNYAPRNYNTLKKWMVEQMKET